MAAILSTAFQAFQPLCASASEFKSQASPLDCFLEGKDSLSGAPGFSVSTSGSDEISDPEAVSDAEPREGGDASEAQEEDCAMGESLDESSLRNYGDWDRIGQQIWRTTEQYLQAMRQKLPNTTFEGVLEAMDAVQSAYPSDSKDQSWSQCALLLHAIRLSTLLPTSPALPDKKPCKKRHLRTKCSPTKRLQTHQTHSVHTKINGEPKAKTGRKPRDYECFICHEVCPYKIALIQHFQVCHHVQKSQSLLYKRVNQSPEAMRRLYGL